MANQSSLWSGRHCRLDKHLQGAELKFCNQEGTMVRKQGNELRTPKEASGNATSKWKIWNLCKSGYEIPLSILKQLQTCACNIWSATVSLASKQQKRLLCSLTLATTRFGVLLPYCFQSIYHCKHYLTAHRITEDQDRNTFKSPEQLSASADF